MVAGAKPGDAVNLVGVTGATLSGATVSAPGGSITLAGLDPAYRLALSSDGAGGSRLAVSDWLFDSGYYLARNPDVAAAGVDAYQHFANSGWREGRNPSSLFDVGYYRTMNPDVAAAGVNPLSHYEISGWREGRAPSLLFSDAKYLAANPDVAAAGVNPLVHYVISGQAEGRARFLSGGMSAPDALVDAAYYNRQLGATLVPEGEAAQQQAAAGYDAYGWQRRLNPNALFDTNYYLQQQPDVAAARINPLSHYEISGWREGRDPSLLFSASKYLAANPDVAAAGAEPLAHYVNFGQGEGRMAFLSGGTAPADPLVDAAFYDRQLGATLLPGGTAGAQQAASSYDTAGWQRGLNPNAFFDTNYYLGRNPDVAAARVNPLRHYEASGWREGRDPSAQFSTQKYLAAYSDVRAAGVNPLEHFVVAGQGEGRTAFAA